MPVLDFHPSSLPCKRFTTSLLTALLAAASSNVANAVVVFAGDASKDVHSELVLYVWDPVTESSYSKDLGVEVNGDDFRVGAPAKNLFVFGQQDAGFQKLWSPLNEDPYFRLFLDKSTNKDNQYWAIFAVGVNSEKEGSAGAQHVYTTLKHQTASGATNPEYTRLLAMTNDGGLTSMVGAIGEGGANNQQNFAPNAANGTSTNHSTVDNGSGFFVKGNNPYPSNWFPNGPTAYFDSQAPILFNKVGMSSWFYHAQRSGSDGEAKVIVDEFDNLTNDAFWGLGVNANGEYILSYTLAGSTIRAQASTEAGINRLSFTDYSAQAGGARLLGLADEVPSFDLGTQVSAVPEPASWGLMALGVAGLVVVARRRRG